MLPASERLPDVWSLIRKEQYFVVHAPRLCGKTTAFRALMDEINAKGEMAAMYCSVEAVQCIADPKVALTSIVAELVSAMSQYKAIFGETAREDLMRFTRGLDFASALKDALEWLSQRAGKPFVVFFDEVDCLERDVLIAFLRQLRNGRISCTAPNSFPVSMALIGLRNIRDYKMFARPEGQPTGEASPFNVITEAMTISLFTEEDMRALYRQHTDETGQVFEEGALEKAWYYSRGQPWLVNALARWCVEKIHKEDFSKPVTAADMDEAKESLIRERDAGFVRLAELPRGVPAFRPAGVPAARRQRRRADHPRDGDRARTARPRRRLRQREVRRGGEDRRALREVAGDGARADPEVHGRPRRFRGLARGGRRGRHEALGRQDFDSRHSLRLQDRPSCPLLTANEVGIGRD